MSTKLSLIAVGQATSVLLATTFVLCVGFDLMVPDMAMYASWQRLLPGFEWISWSDFFLGFIEAYGYGWYIALIWVPVYNVVQHRQQLKKSS